VYSMSQTLDYVTAAVVKLRVGYSLTRISSVKLVALHVL